MRISVNTIKEYTRVDMSIAELTTKINGQLGGIEAVIDLGARYDGATIVKVIGCRKHPNADRLSVCDVDDGSGELTQVVCGAPNVREGIYAVWLKPGMTVPATADDAEPFVLGARELRGVMSHGMLAAGDELGINNDHDGIIELTGVDLPAGKVLVAGASFAETFGLNDTLIDIENKMFTHRPDLFGQLGVAREIAGIQGHMFEEPEWYLNLPTFESRSELELTAYNDAPDGVSRLTVVAMQNIKIAKSPMWLQTTLLRWGAKSINNVVDMTNYIMLLTAQPTHAYDYDKLHGHRLGARMAQPGETVKLLNGKTYELTKDDIVMADADRIVGLAGIMGGADSEVDETTTRIVLEVATFDMYMVRKSAMRHGVFTDALTRFNKGQSPLQNARIVSHLMKGLADTSGAVQASDVYDDIRLDRQVVDQDSMSVALITTPAFVNARLGLSFDASDIGRLLENVHFVADTSSKDILAISAPFWRTDIELPEDIIEEVGRLYGFDRLPRVLPKRSAQPAPRNPTLRLKQAIRERMKAYGANEVLTYSFVHEKILHAADQDTSKAFRLTNALSPDLQYYRLSVLPSLLDKVRANIKSGYDSFVLYELGKGHHKDAYIDDLPEEIELLDMVYASRGSGDNAPFYHMRRFVQQLAADLHMPVEFTAVTDEIHEARYSMFEPTRAAIVRSGEETLGVIGEFKSGVQKSFKLPKGSAGASLIVSGLLGRWNEIPSYTPLSRYPSTSQDLSLKVGSDVAYVDLARIMYGVAPNDDLDITVRPLAIYQSVDEPSERTMTFRFIINSHTRTLTDAEVRSILEERARIARDSFDAHVV